MVMSALEKSEQGMKGWGIGGGVDGGCCFNSGGQGRLD